VVYSTSPGPQARIILGLLPIMQIVQKIDDTESGIGNRHEPTALVLDERGMIRNCSKASEQLFGYRHSKLAWQHISKLFPQLLDVQLVHNGRFNPRLEFLCHCAPPFRGQNQQGNTFDSELHFIHPDHIERRTIRLIVRPSCDAAMQHLNKTLG